MQSYTFFLNYSTSISKYEDLLLILTMNLHAEGA